MSQETAYQKRLLSLAMEKGLLTQADVGFALDSLEICWNWGDQLGLLVASGRITRDQVAELEKLVEEEDDITPSGTQTATVPLELHLSERPTDSKESLFASLGQSFDPKSIEALNALGQYEIRSYLGEGGMGRVFKAWDPRLKREVALKFLRKDDPEAMSRFLLEAQAQAKVKHAGICRVYEAGEVAGYPYIAMQFIDGQSLKDVMHDLTLEQKVVITRDVCEAVHAAHRTGLIHRDIKPGNIMVERSEDDGLIPYVMDFGLAREMEGPRMTATGLAMGTPAYMAPEQARGETSKLDRRTDVYALGGMLFHMLTGRVVFEGTNSFEVIMKVLATDPRPPRFFDQSIPADLDTIVTKCLEKDSRDRYDSARALQKELQRYLDDEPILARPVSLFERLSKKAKKNKAMVGVIGLAAAITLALGVLWIHARWAAGKQAAFAQEFGQKIERLESKLWRTYSLPLHDTAEVKNTIKNQLEEMASQLQEMGRPAQGPGQCALGRGFLAIGQVEKGRRHLESAWEEGFRTPTTAYALGRTYSELYRRELAGLVKIEDSKKRRERKEEIQRELRMPARQYLELSRGADMDSPIYLEALLASADGNYSQAIKLANEAFHQVPHLYQAKWLAGTTHVLVAFQRNESNDRDGATQAIAAAQAAFEAALIIAPSDPRIYLGQSQMCKVDFDLGHYQGKMSEESYRKFIEESQKVLEADSTSAEAFMRIADAHGLWTDYLIRQGQDALPTCEKGLSMARKAATLAPESSETFSTLAGVLLARGKIDMMSQENPEDWFTQAAQAAEKAVALQPDNYSGYSRLALIYLELGNYRISNLKECRDVLEKSRDNLLKSASLSSRSFASVANLGMVHLAMGQNEYNLGRDPTENLRNSASFFTEALEIMPDSIRVQLLVGSVYFYHAKYLLTQDLDPQPMISKTLAAIDGVLAKQPDHVEALFWRASATDKLAEYFIEHEVSPLKAIEDSRRCYRKYLEINQTYPWANSQWAYAELLAAQWLVKIGEDPLEALSRAEEQFKIAQSIFGSKYGYDLRFIEISMLRAQWALMQGQSADAALDEASHHFNAVQPREGIDEYLQLKKTGLAYLRARNESPSIPSPKIVEKLLNQLHLIESNDDFIRKQTAALEADIESWGQPSQ